MILILFLIAAVLFFGAIFAAVKVKKFRIPASAAAVVLLGPVLLTGIISAGYGELVNYPANPRAAVIALFQTLQRAEFAAAEEVIPGTLGIDDTEDGDSAALLQAMSGCWDVELDGACSINGFLAVQPVQLTYVDMEAWLDGLEAESLVTLNEIVQGNRKDKVFNADETAYLEGVTDDAYAGAFARMLERTGEYTVTDSVELRLLWTPFGWRLVLDEALVNRLEGYALGEAGKTVLKGAMTQRLSARLETERAEILANLPLIEKVYKIAADALAAPKPNPDGFGSTNDPNEVLKVIEQAKDLIGDRKLSWNPEIAIKPGSKINYYYDESILVIQWKEFRNWSLATFAEVIIKDGSQIRRVLAGDAYRSWNWETPTQMSQRTNAVLGMTGDFYMFRACGIMVYQGKVYRDDPQSLHHMFVTNSGDLLMTKSWEVKPDEAQTFVDENDVNFSIAFGPVIIEDGKKLEMPRYLVGEFFDDYPRAAIGEVDPLHYVVMTVGKEGPRENQTVTLPEAQQYIWEKGVHKAYALDGGRTANMTFNGELTNEPRYREERTMSDMFYFASAIPEDEYE